MCSSVLVCSTGLYKPQKKMTFSSFKKSENKVEHENKKPDRDDE